MPRTTHANKYNFQLLTIGDSMFVPGTINRIRTAASMWGTRYGIWLSVVAAPQGATVTRLALPPTTPRKRKAAIEETLKRHEDALRFLSLICIEIRDLLQK